MNRKILYVLLSVLTLSALLFEGCKELNEPDFSPPGGRFLTNWQKMQFVGSFNDWDLENAPLMELVDDWTWQTEQRLTEGMVQFKFVPNGNWEVAYGDTHVVKPDSLTGYAVPNASGLGQHIEVSIPQSGLWRVTFNENTLYYEFELVQQELGGVIIGTVEFTDIDSPPYPTATVSLLDTSGSLVKSTTSDTLDGDFEFTGLSEGTYTVIAAASGYVSDTVFDVSVVQGETTEVILRLEPTTGGIVLDGVIDLSEGWQLIDTSQISSPDLQGANLHGLYAAYDDQNLYIAISTYNLSNWELAYGIALDIRDGGFEDDTVDCWNRLIGFSGVGVDYEVYFWWNAETADIGVAQLCEFTAGGWEYHDLQNSQYAFTGDQRNGLAAIEIAIPWEIIGGMPQTDVINIKCWVAGGLENSSAVDGIPYEAALDDALNEWTDTDVFEIMAQIPLTCSN